MGKAAQHKGPFTSCPGDSDGLLWTEISWIYGRGLPKGSTTQSPLLVKQEPHSSVNNIQEKMALEDGICETALYACKRDALFPWQRRNQEASRSCRPLP